MIWTLRYTLRAIENIFAHSSALAGPFHHLTVVHLVLGGVKQRVQTSSVGEFERVQIFPATRTGSRPDSTGFVSVQWDMETTDCYSPSFQ